MNKTVDQHSGANFKNVFFAKFSWKFLAFLAFCTKNAENDYFDQRLECAATKRWSKYTTSKLKKRQQKFKYKETKMCLV